MAAEPASIARAVINQRRAAVLAAVLMAGGFWVAGPMGEWQSGVLFADARIGSSPSGVLVGTALGIVAAGIGFWLRVRGYLKGR